MWRVVVFVAAIAAVGVLLRDEPVAGAHGGVEAVLALQLHPAGDEAVHDLALVEDHRVAAGFAEVAWKCTVRRLQRQLPVDHAPGTFAIARLAQVIGRGKEGFDDIAGGFRITGQPAVLEAPAGCDAARIPLSVTHVLRVAEPVQGGLQMALVRCGGVAGHAAQIGGDQRGMPRTPGLVAQGKLQEGQGIHGSLWLGG